MTDATSPLIAVTADVHLTESHPERLACLQRLLDELRARRIKTLIVAGDLFDAKIKGYKQFDALAGKYPDIAFHVIPGNHDANLDKKAFAAGNVAVHRETTVLTFGDLQVVFVPYRADSSVGRQLLAAGVRSQRLSLLVSHGDVTGEGRARRAYEQVYFPVTAADLARHGIRTGILGHIHEAREEANGALVYTGTLCPVASNEHGPHRYLTVDTRTAAIAPCLFWPDTIHDGLEILLAPGFLMGIPETELIERGMARLIDHWRLPGAPEDVLRRLRLTVKLKGRSENVGHVVDHLKTAAAAAGIAPERLQVETADLHAHLGHESGPGLAPRDWPLIDRVAQRIKQAIDDDYAGREESDALMPGPEEVLNAVLERLHD